MAYYSERHGLRVAAGKTYEVTQDRCRELVKKCEQYLRNLYKMFPNTCSICGKCIGLNGKDFSNHLKYRERTDILHIFSLLKHDQIHYDNYNPYSIFDLVEFMAENMYDFESQFSYCSECQLYIVPANTRNCIENFRKDINHTFDIVGLNYTLTVNGQIERVEDLSLCDTQIMKEFSNIQESGLHMLMQEAIALHKSPRPADHQNAVEKIWDALERLKTYYTNLDKKTSAKEVINNMSNQNIYFGELLDNEFKSLTNIGNEYRIRHHETNKIDITDDRHRDYLFNRCLSLIALAIKYL